MHFEFTNAPVVGFEIQSPCVCPSLSGSVLFSMGSSAAVTVMQTRKNWETNYAPQCGLRPVIPGSEEA